MGSLKKGFLAAALFVLMVSVLLPGRAEAIETSGEASIGVYNTYVWRGVNLGGGEGVVQSSLSLDIDSFSVGYWSNYDFELGELVETDLTLGYTYEAGEVILGGGFIYYGLDGAADTSELYFSLGFVDMILDPSITYYHDFDEGDGGFLTVSIALPLTFENEAVLSFGAEVGVDFKNKIMGTNDDGDLVSGLYNCNISAAFEWPLNNGITITPSVAYTFALSDNAREAIESVQAGIAPTDSSVAYGGVLVSLSF